MQYFIINVSLIIVLLTSCEGNDNRQQEKETIKLEKCDFVQKLQQYQSYVQDGNISKVSEAFKVSNNADLWRIIYFNRDEEIYDQSILSKPFSMTSDFKDQYDNIFSSCFTKCFLIVDVKDLIDKGEYTTNKIQIDEGKVCYMSASYNESRKTIVFVLSYEFFDEGERYEASINYKYQFDHCTIILNEILLIN
jgi:hypothetical protein